MEKKPKTSRTLDLSNEVYERMWLPENYWDSKLDKIPSTLKHKVPVTKYVNNISTYIELGTSLWLWGDYGRGKTAIGAICLKAAAYSRHIGFWIKAKTIPGAIIKETRFDAEQTIIERAETVPLLVIDELQIRKESGFIESSVEDLIRNRIDTKRATVVTTNVTLGTLLQDYPALYNVIQEAYIPVKIEGHDFRAAAKRSL